MELGDTAIVDRLAALAQPHRLAVYRMLAAAGPSGRLPGDLAVELAIPASSLSFHLAHLKRAGLVATARNGRSLRYVADFAAIRALADVLGELCRAVPAQQSRPGDAMRALLERQRG